MFFWNIADDVSTFWNRQVIFSFVLIVAVLKSQWLSVASYKCKLASDIKKGNLSKTWAVTNLSQICREAAHWLRFLFSSAGNEWTFDDVACGLKKNTRFQLKRRCTHQTALMSWLWNNHQKQHRPCDNNFHDELQQLFLISSLLFISQVFCYFDPCLSEWRHRHIKNFKTNFPSYMR